jgi:hypothetical protein
MNCNDVQEQLALGEGVSAEVSIHIRSCLSCTNIALAYSEIDRLLEDTSHSTVVPDGFADRVMVALAKPPARWWEGRAVQIALTNAAAGISLFNLIRFLFRILVPSLSLGGSP